RRRQCSKKVLYVLGAPPAPGEQTLRELPRFNDNTTALIGLKLHSVLMVGFIALNLHGICCAHHLHGETGYNSAYRPPVQRSRVAAPPGCTVEKRTCILKPIGSYHVPPSLPVLCPPSLPIRLSRYRRGERGRRVRLNVNDMSTVSL
ncbi:hypothetical protein NQZ68_017339, partial [Dissostichus eleginoides]